MKITVSLNNIKTELNLTEKKLISDVLKENGFSFSMPCNGRHTCGKCLVQAFGCISNPTCEEYILNKKICDGFRLSCMTYVLGDCEILLNNNNVSELTEDNIMPEKINCSGDSYGFSADIGTTTVAVYLYNLKTGELILKDGFLNPQSGYGSDVISRIEASLNGKSGELSALIKNAIYSSFKKLCDSTNIDKKQINYAVITGNTPMLYLMLEKKVNCLSSMPFEIEDYFDIEIPSCDIGFFDFPNLKIYFPKTISAFIGSDITCSILSNYEYFNNSSCSIMIDIGTNGEMVIAHNKRLLCCSTAAGPALEGSEITMGSLAIDGAISGISLENHKIVTTVLGGGKAESICGSGLIDAIALFLKLNIVDNNGNINKNSSYGNKYITEYNGITAIRIADSGVVITQKDIRGVQLAKAAVCAGIYSLMNECGADCQNIDKLILAGGFGSFINTTNAGIIGLMPKGLSEKSLSVGNSSGKGASLILLNKDFKDKSISIASKAETLDLSQNKFFMTKYIEEMFF